MKKIGCAIFAAAVAVAGSASAQNDPIAQRRAILKGFGEAAKPIADMLKGDTPFDSATVQKSLATFAEGSKKLPGLFPDTSRTGGRTAARSKLWDEKPRFESLFARLGADSVAAAGAITDADSLKASAGKVFGDCKVCHDDYRVKRN